MNPLYQKGFTIHSLRNYFSPYFVGMPRPTADKIFLLLLAILSIQGVHSVRYVYQWFLKIISPKSLNAYYYLFSSDKVSFSSLSHATTKLALTCIPRENEEYPVFLIIDDTLQPKFGTHFEEYQVMFDHARHNGSNYLKGHCFVGLVISVPVTVQGTVRYLNIPLGYRLRAERENKLGIAADMVGQAMLHFPVGKKAILLCDSWYPKGAVRKAVSETPGLELIANVRKDTRLFDLPPAPTGKRGRPPKKGRTLDLQADFDLSLKVGDYWVGTRKVMTTLFSNPVYATVTAVNPKDPSSYRLFLSTIFPEELALGEKAKDSFCPDIPYQSRDTLLPYFFYGRRWAIEVLFYEHKTFWSFGNYMVRSKIGVEVYVNLIAVAYSCVQLLPFHQQEYAYLKEESALTKKQIIGMRIQQELFFYNFVLSLEDRINSFPLLAAFNRWVRQKPSD